MERAAGGRLGAELNTSYALGLGVFVSLAVHLGAAFMPGWRAEDLPRDAVRLDARLALAGSPRTDPAIVAVPPAPKPRPRPRPRAVAAPIAPDTIVAPLPAQSAPAAATSESAVATGEELPDMASSAPVATAEPQAPGVPSSEPMPAGGSEAHDVASSAQIPVASNASAVVASAEPPAASASAPGADETAKVEPRAAKKPISAGASAAKLLPRQGRVRYLGFASLLAGEGEVSWSHDGEVLHSHLAAGLRSLGMSFTYDSVGRVSGPMVISESTSDNRRGKITKARIDTLAGTVVQTRGDDTRTRPISGVAVALSALPQLLAVLNPDLEAANVFIVGDFWVEDATVVNRGREMLRLDSGEVATRHYHCRTQDGKLIDIWLAPDWQNAPARIRIEAGTAIDLRAVEVEVDGVMLLQAPGGASTSLRRDPTAAPAAALARVRQLG